ncbi:MAG: hypothetical protein KF897_05595 [Opitutaceae bacterium]|nr:hypothetical protein [Opitutaceae bacterium]
MPRTDGWFPAAFIAMAWTGLWALGFPLSHHDDTFFAGVAIELARHGQLANPWLADWIGHLAVLDPQRYLIQPPLQPWLCALWLKCFGVSAAAFTGYACTLGAIGSLALLRLLRRQHLGVGPALLGVGAFAAVMLTRGLRPEVTGLPLLALAALLLPGAHWVPRLAGATLAIAAPFAHPFLLVFSVALILHAWTNPALRPGHPWETGAVAASALAINVAFLLWAIGGAWREFIHDLYTHARFVQPPMALRPARFADQLTLGWEIWPNIAVLVLSGTALALAWRRTLAPRDHLRSLGLLLAGLLLFGICLYPQFTVTFLTATCAIGILTLASRGFTPRWLSLAPVLILLGWVGGQQAIQRWADSRVSSGADAVAAWLATAVPAEIGFDAATLRHVFDFNPPGRVHALDWNGGRGAAPAWSDPAQLGPRQAWIANPGILASLRNRSVPRPVFTLLGHTLRSVRPRTAAVIVYGSALPPPDGSVISAVPSSHLADPSP